MNAPLAAGEPSRQVAEAHASALPARPQVTSTSLKLPKQHAVDTPSTAGALGTTLLALVFVIGLIVVLGKLAKRLPGVGAATGTGALRVVASVPLSAKDRALVVDVNGTQLLIGIGAGGPRVLHQLDEPLPAPEAKPALAFSDVLAYLRKQK